MRGAVAYSGQGIGLATWTGRRFDSRQLHFHVVPQPWASRSHTHVSQLPSSVVCYQPKGGGSIDVKKRFYVFIQGTFLTFFILPTFFIFKNVHWKCHLKSLSKQRKQIGSVWLFFFVPMLEFPYRPLCWKALLLTYRIGFPSTYTSRHAWESSSSSSSSSSKNWFRWHNVNH